MNLSPCKIASSMKAKFKAIRTHQHSHQMSNFSLNDRSCIKTSIHTIQVKESPQKVLNSTVHFDSRVQQSNQPHLPSKFIPKKYSPINKISLSNKQRMKGLKNSKSLSQLVSSHGPSHGILVTQEKRLSSKSKSQKSQEQQPFRQVIHPFEVISTPNNEKRTIRPRLSQDRPFLKVQQTQNCRRLSSTKMFSAPPELVQKVMSPPKSSFHPSIHPPVQKETTPTQTDRQVELERRIKVLQIRVGELHLEKNAAETRLNQLNIRLQYENNFLKEKLNSYPSMNQIGTLKKVDSKRESIKGSFREAIIGSNISQNNGQTPSKSQNTLFFTCPIDQPTLQKMQSSSSRGRNGLDKLQMVNTQEHYYNQNCLGNPVSIESREIISVKQQLFEAEEMLSKEIGKNFKLLEDLNAQEKIKEQLGEDIRKLQLKIEAQNKEIEALNQLIEKQRAITKSLHSQQSSIASIVVNQVATQTARITKQFQDKIFNLEMEINWLNEKLQETEKKGSQQKLSSKKYNSGTKVQVVDKFNLAMNVELTKENISLQENIQQLQKQIQQLKQENVQFEQENVQLEKENLKLKQKNQDLEKRIESMKQQDLQQFGPIQLVKELKENNSIYMYTIKSLQKSLFLTQSSLQETTRTKHQLEKKVTDLQTQLNNQNFKQTQYEEQVQEISTKLQQISELVQQKSNQIDAFHERFFSKDHLLHQKEQILFILQEKIETLKKQNEALRKERDEQQNASTQNSYYEKLSDPQNCTKCNQLRKSVIKLNSYLNQSLSSSYLTFRPQ